MRSHGAQVNSFPVNQGAGFRPQRGNPRRCLTGPAHFVDPLRRLHPSANKPPLAERRLHLSAPLATRRLRLGIPPRTAGRCSPPGTGRSSRVRSLRTVPTGRHVRPFTVECRPERAAKTPLPGTERTRQSAPGAVAVDLSVRGFGGTERHRSRKRRRDLCALRRTAPRAADTAGLGRRIAPGFCRAPLSGFRSGPAVRLPSESAVRLRFGPCCPAAAGLVGRRGEAGSRERRTTMRAVGRSLQ